MPYKLTESVPYLLNRIGVTLGDRFSQRLREYDITLSMYRVLAALKQTGSQTLGELSSVVTVETSTLSRLIGTMEKKKLITRVRPADNARIVQIDLTAAGSELAQKLRPIAIQFEDIAISGLKETQVNDLKLILNHMHDQLSRL